MSLLRRLEKSLNSDGFEREKEVTGEPISGSPPTALSTEGRLLQIRNQIMDLVLGSLPANAEQLGEIPLRNLIDDAITNACQTLGLSIRPEERRFLVEEFLNEETPLFGAD